MIEIKKDANTPVPFRLLDSATGAPVNGKTNADMTITFYMSDRSEVTFAPGAATIDEVVVGAFASSGTYLVYTGTGLNIAGPCEYAVAVTGCRLYVGAIKIVANEEVDTFSRIGAPVGASVSADIASITAIVSTLKDYEEGRWKIDKTAKTMTFYKLDGITVVKVFNLKDDLGVASATNIFERVPV